MCRPTVHQQQLICDNDGCFNFTNYLFIATGDGAAKVEIGDGAANVEIGDGAANVETGDGVANVEIGDGVANVDETGDGVANVDKLSSYIAMASTNFSQDKSPISSRQSPRK